MTKSRLIWYFKQLLPLTYRTRYSNGDGRHFAVWKMWFGRVFRYDDVLIRE